jgi:hypothetical protein
VKYNKEKVGKREIGREENTEKGGNKKEKQVKRND